MEAIKWPCGRSNLSQLSMNGWSLWFKTQEIKIQTVGDILPDISVNCQQIVQKCYSFSLIPVQPNPSCYENFTLTFLAWWCYVLILDPPYTRPCL